MQNLDNNTKISIVIPVYNVDKYLVRCLESLIMQNYDNFEVILIDDGSTDNSPFILDEYKNKDKRFNVIHKQNEGAPVARNIGIELAKGKYICFFDADDYIEKDTLLDSFTKIDENGLDMLVSGFFIDTYIKNDKYKIFDYIPIDDSIYHDEKEFRKNAYKYFDNNMLYSPWNKIIKREYLIDNSIRFKRLYRDDFPFVVDVIKDIKNIGFTKKQYYHFCRERKDSETSKYVSILYDKRQEEHKMLCNLYKDWGLINHYYSYEMISRRYIDRFIECIVNLIDKNNEMRFMKKLDTLSKYLSNEYFDSAIKSAKPKSFYLKILYMILKTKNRYLIYMVCFIIYIVKNKNIGLFSVLKTNR